MSFWRKELVKRVKWILLIRLLMFFTIFVATVVLGKTNTFLFKLLVIYSFFILFYLLTLFFWRYIEKRVNFVFLYAILAIVEILIELGIIHASGGVASPLYVLLVVTVVSSALVFNLVGTVLLASLASVAYAVMVYLEFKGILKFNAYNQITNIIYSESDTLFFGAYTFVCFLYLLSFVGGYLSGQLRIRINQLELTAKELSKLRLDTKAIVESMRSGLIAVDERKVAQYGNSAACKLLGLDGNLIGKALSDIFPPRFHRLIEKIDNMLWGIENKEVKDEIEAEINGQKKIFLFMLSAIEYNGIISGVVIIFDDITEKKRFEEYIRSVERFASLGEISVRLAHEIRNPLASIKGSAELLAEEGELEKHSKDELFRLIVGESEKLSKTIENFLQFARIGKKEKKELVSIPIKRILAETIEEIKSQPSFDKNIEFSIEPGSSSELWVLGERSSVKQIFLNLVQNAVQSIDKEKGQVKIFFEETCLEFDKKNRYLGVVVEDNGCGIENDRLYEIFEPFYTTKKGGTGLGLSIAQKAAMELGGIIKVESKVGVGSKFTVYLRKV